MTDTELFANREAWLLRSYFHGFTPDNSGVLVVPDYLPHADHASDLMLPT